jgi:hypothetical protein
MRKGKQLALVQTRGVEHGQYDLFDLEGLSLGKVEMIRRALARDRSSLDFEIYDELLAVLKNLPVHQTINGK